MSKFETKEEAKKHLKKSRNKMNHVFCPLSNRDCNKNCVCYNDGQMYPIHEGMSFVVHEAKCDNKMFKD